MYKLRLAFLFALLLTIPSPVGAEDLDEKLRLAAALGDLVRVEALLASGAMVNGEPAGSKSGGNSSSGLVISTTGELVPATTGSLLELSQYIWPFGAVVLNQNSMVIKLSLSVAR